MRFALQGPWGQRAAAWWRNSNGLLRSPRRRRHAGARLLLEPLEERALLAVTPLGDEFVVNTFTGADQQTSGNQAVAMDAAGDFVVVWQSKGQDGDGWGIYGQRFDPAGQKLGEEFRVNTTTAGDQTSPAVAMNGSGRFVVAWQSFGQDTDGWGVFAQRYGADGLPAGPEFPVNEETAGDQKSPVIDLNDSGEFAVGWGGTAGHVRRFLTDGSPAWQEIPTDNPVSVGIDGAGNLSVASFGWVSDFPSYTVWKVRHYSADGGDQGLAGRWGGPYPSVSSFAMAVNEAGTLAVGGVVGGFTSAPEIWFPLWYPVNPAPTPPNGTSLAEPALAIGPVGNTAVAYAQRSSETAPWQVMAQTLTSSHSPDGDAFPVLAVAADQTRPSVALGGHGLMAVVWTTLTSGQSELSARLFTVTVPQVDQTPPTVGQVAAGASESTLEVLPDGGAVFGWPQFFSVSFDEPMVAAGPQSPASLLNPANWLLWRDGEDLSGRLHIQQADPTKMLLWVDPPLERGDYELSVSGRLRDLAGNRLFGSQAEGPGSDYRLTFRVDANPIDTSPGDAVELRSAVTPDGGLVVVWRNGSEVWARRSGPNLDPLGDRIRVNQTAADPQQAPSVAAAVDGTFLVVWSSDNGRVYARRFAAGGEPLGNEFRIAMDEAAIQRDGLVALRGNGAFVVTWLEWKEGAEQRIWGRKVGLEGQFLGEAFAVFESPGGQYLSDIAVAMNSLGQFVVAWSHWNSPSIVARRFDAAGVPTGESRPVSSHLLPGSMGAPSLALDDRGTLLVSWTERTERYDGGVTHLEWDLREVLAFRRYSPDFTLLNEETVVSAGSAGLWFGTGPFPDIPQRPNVSSQQISVSGDGTYALTWSDRNGVTVRLYDGQGHLVREAKTTGQGATVAFHESTASVAWYAGSAMFAQRLKSAVAELVGDANGDHKVDLADFGILKENFGKSPATAVDGDLNGDAKVDLTDFGILKDNFGPPGC